MYVGVSVLFSEPKIPQFGGGAVTASRVSRFQCSSASRKFLNSTATGVLARVRVTFQCSSASRKFLNRDTVRVEIDAHRVSVLFSEPKIPQLRSIGRTRLHLRMFQCSSASRKFLNVVVAVAVAKDNDVSVLFSEPKIPQFDGRSASRRR